MRPVTAESSKSDTAGGLGADCTSIDFGSRRPLGMGSMPLDSDTSSSDYGEDEWEAESPRARHAFSSDEEEVELILARPDHHIPTLPTALEEPGERAAAQTCTRGSNSTEASSESEVAAADEGSNTEEISLINAELAALGFQFRDDDSSTAVDTELPYPQTEAVGMTSTRPESTDLAQLYPRTQAVGMAGATESQQIARDASAGELSLAINAALVPASGPEPQTRLGPEDEPDVGLLSAAGPEPELELEPEPEPEPELELEPESARKPKSDFAFSETQEVESAAAVCIQAVQRGHQQRQKLMQRQAAAIKVQAIHRGHSLRRSRASAEHTTCVSLSDELAQLDTENAAIERKLQERDQEIARLNTRIATVTVRPVDRSRQGAVPPRQAKDKIKPSPRKIARRRLVKSAREATEALWQRQLDYMRNKQIWAEREAAKKLEIEMSMCTPFEKRRRPPAKLSSVRPGQQRPPWRGGVLSTVGSPFFPTAPPMQPNASVRPRPPPKATTPLYSGVQ